jgi:hypothetical protein
MQLRHIDIGKLIAAAGGDPWAVDKSLQAGRPAAIADLGQAFHNAGQCTAEASNAFTQARRQFDQAWNRENGEHPIDDSAEVQRVTRSLGPQAAQLPLIAVDLENIAATLAEAQRNSAAQISTLNTQLKQIDDAIGQAEDLENSGHLTAEQKQQIDRHISDLEHQAIDDTKVTLGQVDQTRDHYSDSLQKSLTHLRTDGYDPDAIKGLDSPGQTSQEKQDQRAVATYDATQRAKDQALVNSPGPTTAEKTDAAARLRDYATATDPAAGADARGLASERLDDFTMSHFAGPLPADPVMGGDARTRAQGRMQMQNLLTSPDAFPGRPQLTPNQATQLIDQWEAQGRSMVLDKFRSQLVQAGVSPEGARQAVNAIENGAAPQDVLRGQLKGGATLTGAASEGTKALADATPTGQHWNPPANFTPEDAEALKRFGSRLGWAGNVLEGVVAWYDIEHGAPPLEAGAKAGGSILGSMGGGWLAGTAAGSWLGPEVALPAGIAGAVVGGAAVEKGVEKILKVLGD